MGWSRRVSFLRNSAALLQFLNLRTAEFKNNSALHKSTIAARGFNREGYRTGIHPGRLKGKGSDEGRENAGGAFIACRALCAVKT